MVAGNVASLDPLRLVEQVGAVAGFARTYSTDGAQRLLTELLIPWASKVAMKAPSKWMMSRHLAPICALDNGRHCANPPISACHICGRPVCLQHALISIDADVVCWACVIVAGKHGKKWQPPRATPPPAAGQVDPLGWAFKVLGVEPSCTSEELRKAYKRMAKRYHPDRAGDDKSGAELDAQLLKTLNDAYARIVAQKKQNEATA